VNVDDIVKLPSNLKIEDAACIPTYLQAYGILHQFKTIQPGDIIIQNNADNIISKAVEQIGQKKGYIVKSIKNSDFASNGIIGMLRENKTKYIISGMAGKPTSTILKALAKDGTLVVYEGIPQSVTNISSIDVPVSSQIFFNSHIQGFDLFTWMKSTDSTIVKNAIQDIVNMLESRSISLQPQLFELKDYTTAFSVADNANNAVVLQFSK
jgi:NADPH:quinone reductase-like Zn-dependent oxidoreductase